MEVNINEVKNLTKKAELDPIAEALGIEYPNNVMAYKKQIVERLEQLESEQAAETPSEATEAPVSPSEPENDKVPTEPELENPGAVEDFERFQEKNGFVIYRNGDKAYLTDTEGKKLSKIMDFDECMRAFDRFSSK